MTATSRSMFYGPGVKPGRYDEFARVVDLAPTLAAMLKR